MKHVLTSAIPMKRGCSEIHAGYDGTLVSMHVEINLLL